MSSSETFRMSNKIDIDCIFVEGGAFQMGQPDPNIGALGWTFNEQPVHSITISDFYISKYEITFDQYDKFCEATNRKKPDDYGWGRESRPVTNVNWGDANAFCEWAGVRLPTEAEWEYAARGGNKSKGYKYAGSNDADEVGWYKENSDAKIHSVGMKAANELGLYDMSGNIWEWCSDWYGMNYYKDSPGNNPKGPLKGDERVLRGGSWSNYSLNLRICYRNYNSPIYANNNYGIRVVLSAVH
jgi:formylglycine-generating enzyme required for sulfatase activity